MCDTTITTIFTDASFDPKSKLAVFGYMINGIITTATLTETTNTEAELCTILWVMDF